MGDHRLADHWFGQQQLMTPSLAGPRMVWGDALLGLFASLFSFAHIPWGGAIAAVLLFFVLLTLATQQKLLPAGLQSPVLGAMVLSMLAAPLIGLPFTHAEDVSKAENRRLAPAPTAPGPVVVGPPPPGTVTPEIPQIFPVTAEPAGPAGTNGSAPGATTTTTNGSKPDTPTDA